MATTLRDEVDALTAERQRLDRDRPGAMWGDGSMSLTPAEAEVFSIAYDEFARMLSVWDAWLWFLGLAVMADVEPFSKQALERERALRPELLGPVDWAPFKIFAKEVGRLTERQAEAIFWKELFFLVRAGNAVYPQEQP